MQWVNSPPHPFYTDENRQEENTVKKQPRRCQTVISHGVSQETTAVALAILMDATHISSKKKLPRTAEIVQEEIHSQA